MAGSKPESKSSVSECPHTLTTVTREFSEETSQPNARPADTLALGTLIPTVESDLLDAQF